MKPPLTEVYTMGAGQYNAKASKIRSSITWIISFSSLKNKGRKICSEDCFERTGALTSTAAEYLISGTPYRRLIYYVFKIHPSGDRYESIIQTLSQYGMFFLKSEDSVITCDQLEANPIYMDAHLQLIDMLMNAAASKLWASTLNVVTSVKRFSTFFASKELPTNNEESIILWLGKVCCKVQQLEEVSEVHKTSSNRTYPTVTEDVDDLCDSCVLALVIHFYCPHMIPSEDIILNSLMSIADSLHNLQISLEFCYETLFPSYNLPSMEDFLSAEDFLQCSEELRQNFLTFYAFLFYCFEVDPHPEFVKPRDGHMKKCASKQNETRPHSAHQPLLRLSNLHEKSDADAAKILPEAKSLLSEATIRSFLPTSRSNSSCSNSSTSNLQTTFSRSTPDLAAKVAHMGVPQVPLLPKRQQEGRPPSRATPRLSSRRLENSSLRKSTSLDDVTNGVPEAANTPSKWNTRVQAFSVYKDETVTPERPSYETDAHSSATFNYPGGTSLLSRVEVDDEVDDILSGRVRDSEDLNLTQSFDLEWSGFTKGEMNKSRTDKENVSVNAGDMLLETVRTNEHRSPLSTTRTKFNARPLTDSGDWVGDTSSDITSVTNLTSDLNGLGDGLDDFSPFISSTSKETTFSASRTSNVGISADSPEKSSLRSPWTLSELKTSYIVENGNFNTADSARAAGYPVIIDPTEAHSIHLKEEESRVGNCAFQDERAETRKSHRARLADSPLRASATIISPNKVADTSPQKIQETRWSCLAQQRGYRDNSSNNKVVTRPDALELFRQLELSRQKSAKREAEYRLKDARYAELLHQFELLKRETALTKQTNFRLNMQLKQPKNLKGEFISDKSGVTKKDEISSDYSSKSPSPATSERNLEGNTSETLPAEQLSSDLSVLQSQSNESGNTIMGSFDMDTVIFVPRNIEKLKQSIDENQNFNNRVMQNNQTQILSRSDVDARLNNPSSSNKMTPGITSKVNSPQSASGSSRNKHKDLSSQSPTRSHAKASNVVMTETAVEDSQTRRSLFPSGSKGHKQDPETSQESHDISINYNTFSDRIKSSSCQSTPSKSPRATSSQARDDSFSNLDDSERRAMGFTIVDENSPASKLAKKKEQFLLSRLKKEEEQRKKQMEREKESEVRKVEARLQQERALQKKVEEKEKREKRLKEYQKRKKQEEEASLHQVGVIGSSGSAKKTPKVKLTPQHPERDESSRNLEHDVPSTSRGLTVPFSPKIFAHRSSSREDDSDSLGSTPGSEYTGPKLYKQLSVKSNRTLIMNSLNHCCLSGKVNEPVRNKTLQALEQSEARHLMVLFRDGKCQYRGLYSYHPDEEKLHKICGTGPHTITPPMIESLFKYNSGRRSFSSVPSKTLSVSIDGITIKNSLWQHAKK
ncbi:calmodulin-regulated spectrin-associated protein 1-B-like isoform X3 [Clavelina lepadiformis]|uniref:calmodulin-regulated spectrin-associated protein 1-B-like isoform X3 n=1 Tax=Clavelina lepadiformis TaxID=159417 RepID=UPI004041D580